LLVLLSLCVLVALITVRPVHSQTTDVDNETCLDCHDARDTTLAPTAHRLTPDPSTATNPVACVSCHTGAETHLDDPDIGTIGNPATQSAAATEQVCSTCHEPHISSGLAGFDPHLGQSVSCTDCHVIHGHNRSQLIDEEADFCGNCHISITDQFSRRSNHPLKDHALTCLNCHDFTRRAGNALPYDLDRVCRDCHPMQSGPFLYEHEAGHGYAVEGSGCVACHQPHGSENDYLLMQPGNQLCRQCHIGHVTRNHDRLWEAVFSRLTCQECHTATHGSYVSRYYLDPDLPAKLGGDCYQSGCHNLSGE